MDKEQQTNLSLKEIREARGLTARQAAVQVAAFLNEKSRTHAFILKIEKEGTKLDDVIEAMASVYKYPEQKVRTAARLLRLAHKERQQVDENTVKI